MRDKLNGRFQKRWRFTELGRNLSKHELKRVRKDDFRYLRKLSDEREHVRVCK